MRGGPDDGIGPLGRHPAGRPHSTALPPDAAAGRIRPRSAARPIAPPEARPRAPPRVPPLLLDAGPARVPHAGPVGRVRHRAAPPAPPALRRRHPRRQRTGGGAVARGDRRAPRRECARRLHQPVPRRPDRRPADERPPAADLRPSPGPVRRLLRARRDGRPHVALHLGPGCRRAGAHRRPSAGGLHGADHRDRRRDPLLRGVAPGRPRAGAPAPRVRDPAVARAARGRGERPPAGGPRPRHQRHPRERGGAARREELLAPRAPARRVPGSPRAPRAEQRAVRAVERAARRGDDRQQLLGAGHRHVRRHAPDAAGPSCPSAR